MQFGDEPQLFPRQISLLTSAEAADQHYASCSLSLERLSASESQTRAKLTKILLANQESYDRQQLDKVLVQLKTLQDNEEKSRKEAAEIHRQQMKETEDRIKQLEADRSRFLMCERKLEVCEAHYGTLLSEKAGLTAELTAAQAQVRRLYKELQQRKNQQAKYAYDHAVVNQRARYQGSFLTPPELWENTKTNSDNVKALCHGGRNLTTTHGKPTPMRDSSVVKVKPAVMPRQSRPVSRLQSTPLGSTENPGVEEKDYLSDNVEILLTVDEKNMTDNINESKDCMKSRLRSKGQRNVGGNSNHTTRGKQKAK